jgi:hypothetical protein
MLRVLWHARNASRRLFTKNAETQWVFAGHKGHTRGHRSRLEPRPAASVRERGPGRGRTKGQHPSISKHSGGDITDHYIRDSALGQLQLAEKETINASNASQARLSLRDRLVAHWG